MANIPAEWLSAGRGELVDTCEVCQYVSIHTNKDHGNETNGVIKSFPMQTQNMSGYAINNNNAIMIF